MSDQDENALDPSTGTEGDDAGTPPAREDATADAPAAADQPSIYDLADAALSEKRGEAAKADEADAEDPADDADDKAKAKDEGKSDDDPADDRIPDEEFKKLGPKAQKRIHGLSKKLGEARDETRALARERDEFKTDAEAYREFSGAVEQAGLSWKEVDDLLVVGKVLAAGDPEQIIKMIEPHYRWALEQTGRALSPEFQAKVDANEMTQEAAAEAQRLRASAEAANQKLNARNDADAQARATAERQRETVEKINAAGREAFAALGREDQGLDQEKSRRILEWVKGYCEENGAVTEPAAVKALIRMGHQAVTAQDAATARPKPKPTPPQPTRGKSPAVKSAQPSIYDLADEALAGLNR